MAKLSTEQINELKEKGFITQVIPSGDLANNTVDELKNKLFITSTDKSNDIENSLTPGGETTITIDPAAVTLTQGSEEITQIRATVTTPDGSKPAITWHSADDTKVTITLPPEGEEYYGMVGLSATNLLGKGEELLVTATANGVTGTCVVTGANPL